MKIIKENLFLDILLLLLLLLLLMMFFSYMERDEKNITIIFLEMGKNSDII